MQLPDFRRLFELVFLDLLLECFLDFFEDNMDPDVELVLSSFFFTRVAMFG